MGMTRRRAGRRIALFLLVLGAVATAGCVDGQMLILVQPGGSGTISLDASVSEAGLNQARNTLILLTELGVLDRAEVEETLGMPLGDLRGERVDALVTPDRLRSIAVQWGRGVRLLRYQTRLEGGRHGFAALYGFDDVRALRLGPIELDGTAAPDWFYSFTLAPSDPATLTMVPPPREAFAATAEAPDMMDVFLRSLQDSPGADTLFSPILRDARLRLRLQVAGTVLSTSADYPAGEGSNTFFLFDAAAGRMESPMGVLRLLRVRSPDGLLALSRQPGSGIRLQDPLRPFHVSFE